MKKLFKKLALAFVAVLTLSVGTGTVREVKAEGTGSYVKVTEAPSDWSGTYLIVYETGSVAFDGSLTTLDAAKNNFSVTINNYEIAQSSEIDSKAFTIEKNGTTYSIKSASGYYIGNTADSNKLNSSTSTKYTNTITLESDKTVKIVGSGKSVLRFNSASDNLRFRYFKSGTYTSQKAINLYKLTEGGNDTPPTPEVKDPTIKISGNSYIDLGNTLQLETQTTNFDGTVIWTSSDVTVATVDNGMVKPISMGKTTITATAGSAEASMDIIVYPTNNSKLTISEAIEVCELVGNEKTPYKYSVSGKVTNLSYSSQYKSYTADIVN